MHNKYRFIAAIAALALFIALPFAMAKPSVEQQLIAPAREALIGEAGIDERLLEWALVERRQPDMAGMPPETDVVVFTSSISGLAYEVHLHPTTRAVLLAQAFEQGPDYCHVTTLIGSAQAGTDEFRAGFPA